MKKLNKIENQSFPCDLTKIQKMKKLGKQEGDY